MPLAQIDMNEMVKEHKGVKTEADLDKFCTDLYNSDLGLKLPRWRAYLINNMADGRSMMCIAVDHAIGDGPALIAAMMDMLDAQPNMPGVSNTKRKTKPPGCFARVGAIVGGVCSALCGDQMPADKPNRLKLKDHRNPGTSKSVAQTAPIAKAKLREVAEKFGGATLNDVLMVVFSETMRLYFEKYDPATLKNRVRANFPINMRPAGADHLDDKYFGNQFSQGQLRFPIHIEDPWAALPNIKKQIDTIKISPEPLLRQKLVDTLAFSTLVSTSTKKDIILDAYGQVTAMLSNIAGPSAEVSFAGQPVENMAFYAFAPIGLYFGIVSYKDEFRAGVCCDATSEPDSHKLATAWNQAWDRVYAAATTRE
jgi:hypothetical protein